MVDHSPDVAGELAEELVLFVKPELEPGERLLWAARPGFRGRGRSGRFFVGAAVWAVGFFFLCLVCIGGTAFGSGPRFEASVVVMATVGAIAGVASFLIVVGSIASFVSGDQDRSDRTGQTYALTDRRAIIQIQDSRTQAVTVHSYHRGTIKSELLHRIQYPDGSGDVLFQETYTQPRGFLDVADVRRVEDLIRRFLIVPIPTSTA